VSSLLEKPSSTSSQTQNKEADAQRSRRLFSFTSTGPGVHWPTGHGSTGSRVHGNMGPRVHGSTGTWEHGSMGAWEHGSTSTGGSDPRGHGGIGLQDRGLTFPRVNGFVDVLRLNLTLLVLLDQVGNEGVPLVLFDHRHAIQVPQQVTFLLHQELSVGV